MKNGYQPKGVVLPTSPKPAIGNSAIGNDYITQERIGVLVQALKLSLRQVDGRSGLDKEEYKNYIKTVLKVY